MHRDTQALPACIICFLTGRQPLWVPEIVAGPEMTGRMRLSVLALVKKRHSGAPEAVICFHPYLLPSQVLISSYSDFQRFLTCLRRRLRRWKLCWITAYGQL